MKITTLSDSETPRETYDKDVGSLVRMTTLSDSETSRDTYEKVIRYLPQDSVLNTLFHNRILLPMITSIPYLSVFHLDL